MSRVTVSVGKYIKSRSSRRDISSSSSKRSSTSPQRWSAAAPAVATNLKPFSDIPGPGTLPILKYSYHVLPRIGNFHHTVGLGLLEGLRNKYGDLVRLGKGLRSRPMLYVFDPEMMREVYESGVTEPPVWERSPLRHHRTAVGDRCPLHSQESQAIWAAVRSLLHDDLLLRNYEHAFDQIAADFTRRLGELRHVENALNEEIETEVYRWATETVGAVVFGIRLGCLDGPAYVPTAENRPPEKASMDDHVPELCSLLRRPTEELSMAERLVRYSREIADNNYLVRSEGTLKTESRTFNEALKAIDRHFSSTEKFLNKALQALTLEKLRPEQALLNKLKPLGTRILPLAADALLAGVEPLAASALSMLQLSSLHAAAQQRVHDEVECGAASEQAGARAPPPHCATASALEALRLRPPTGAVLRRSTNSLALVGHEVPPGVDIVLAHGVTSQCEKQWGRGKAFVPERWLEQGWRPLLASRAHGCAARPFGELCPAAGAAPRALAALATRVLHRYRLEWHGPAPNICAASVNRLLPPYYFVLQDAC